MELKLEKNCDLAIKIMKEVSKNHRELGHKVWLDEWLDKEQLLNEEVTEDDFYVGYINEIPLIAFILQNTDKEWWENNNDKAVYLHKLCIKNNGTLKNMTGLLIETLKAELKQKGIKYIRLDTGYNEDKVKSIYIKNGFKIVKILELKNGNKMALFEMKI